MAPFTIIAFSKFSFFNKFDIFISCLTISTIRRPASCAKTYRLESTAGIAALVCKAMPIDSAKLAIVEAVPIVIQCPADLELSCSADINSSSVISPAFTISENFQVCVPDPINCPLYRPFNIGPPDTTSVGKSQEAAPIINAGVHMLAIAGRMGINITLDDWDRLGRDIPCLVNLMPSGEYLMEDFFYAGGLPAVIKELEQWINKDAMTANGNTIWENCQDAECYSRDVIYSVNKPFKPNGGIAVLKGNLAPDGAIIKPSAASPDLMVHRGRAVVFESIEEYHSRIDDPELDIDETCIMVLKYCGPKGYPGMAEVGNMGLPSKVLKKGITDMVRISDARMSGTAYGTVVLHTAPEAAAGGPLAFVENGDFIELDVPNRKLNLEISDEELAKRKAGWKGFSSPYERGYTKIYVDHVNQANQGADLDFLVGKSGTPILRESH